MLLTAVLTVVFRFFCFVYIVYTAFWLRSIVEQRTAVEQQLDILSLFREGVSYRTTTGTP